MKKEKKPANPFPMTSAQVIERVRKETDTVFLAFSAGKDSVATWLAIRGKFKRIIPYHMYLIPGLSFVEEGIAYYEKVFRTKVLRLPHPSLHRMLNNFTFQPPERCAVIERAALPDFEYYDVFTALCDDYGLDPQEVMTASGVRAVDSPMRWMHFRKRGAITWSTRTFYPVFDWRKDYLIQQIREAKVKLPPEYKYFGRSFDGLDLRFLLPIREHFPKDYKKILRWFPLAELEIFRYEASKEKV